MPLTSGNSGSMPSIPARILDLADSEVLGLQTIENLHRIDMQELDEAFRAETSLA